MLEAVADVVLARQVVGLPVQQQGQVAVQCLVQDHLRVRHHHHLRAVLGRSVAQQHIDLLLSQDFQMGVWLIHQQHTSLVGVEVGKDQQHLLKAAPRRGNVERHFHARLPVHQFDTAARRFARWGQLDVEQPVHQPRQALPVRRRLALHHQAEVAQDLRCLPLTQQHVDAAGLQQRLLGLQARHGVQQFHLDARRMRNQFHVFGGRSIGRAVHQFVTVVAESHLQRHHLALEFDPDRDDQGDVFAAMPNMGVVPEEPGAAHRNGHDVQAIQWGGGALLGRRFLANVVPCTYCLRPQGQRLNRAGLAAVVGPDQHRRMVQFNTLTLAKALEVLDLDVVQ